MSRRRAAAIGLEVFASFGAAGALTWSAIGIRVDPLERVGQVSALAAIGLRFTLAGLALIAALWLASRLRRGVAFGVATRVACGALAGLATGFVAAGVLVALRGTPWGLNGNYGDAGRLMRWSDAAQHGREWPFYPPLPVHTIALYAQAMDLPTGFALKHLQIIGTALVGPLAYVTWRLLLPPVWALGVGVIAALPVLDPYKPYANTVLILLVPWLVCLLGWLQRAPELGYRALVALGVAFGLGFALLYYTYYGWFQWSAPGAVVAALVSFPWGDARARKRAACLLGAATLVFLALSGPLVLRALREGFDDNFFYFDTQTDPAYFAMWRWDLPGPVGEWPPPGELSGVGVFTLLLAAGLGVAVALGRRHVPVVTLAWLVAGAWVLRLWYAQRMWETKLVQLYPRTSIEILYCSLVLAGYAVFLVCQRLTRARTLAGTPQLAGGQGAPAASYLIGAVCALLLVLGSAGSGMSDRYMPRDQKPPSLGRLAWYAHHTRP